MVQKRYEKRYSSIIPIRTVACLENYCRDIYADLIDSDNEVRNRISSKWKDWSISLKDLALLDSNYLSLGDFISFQIPCNKVEDIIETLSVFYGCSFFDRIKQKKDGTSLLVVMNELFKIRHIYAHEAAFSFKISKEKAIDYLNSTIRFIEYIDEFIEPEGPSTTIEQISHESSCFKASSEKLNAVIQNLKQNFDPEDFDSFGYIKIWEKYREERAQYDRKVFEGGSLEAVAYLMSLTETTEDEYNSLKRRYRHILRGLSNI